nr:toll-like receptor 3 [Lytechinus pictus]
MPFLGMKSLINLTMNNDNISDIISVINATEIRLSIPKLRMISLASNRLIKVIPSKGFDGLEELEHLHIFGCQITHLHNDSFTGLTSLKLLNLEGNKITEIHGRIFTSFSNLQTLQLSNNELSLQSAVQITGLRTLQSLFLDGNHIQFSTPLVWDLPNLSSLHLSNNGIIFLSANSFLGLENLSHLTLSKNQISIIRNNAFGGLPHLQKLDLSAGGNIGSFASPFQNLQQLIEIDMSGTSFHPIQQIFLGLVSLRRLSLSRCSLTRDSLWDSVKNASIFATVSQLEFLYLNWNSLNAMHSGSFHPLYSLTTLKLDHCAISVLHSDIFRNLSSLEFLYIEYNYIKVISPQHLLELHSLMALYAQNNDIKQINKEAFSEKKHFLTLNIANNGISWIEEGTVLPRRNLDISNNPLACVCKLMWFRMELDKRNLTLGKSHDTTCSQTSIPSLVGEPLLSFNPKHSCAPNIALYIGLSILVVCIIFGTVTTYHKRWWISYKCFHLKLWIIGYEEFQDGREHLDFTYDVNIIFDEDDEEWVKNILKPGIQEHLPHLNRILLGDRDLPLDMFYMDAVIYVIENSYKTILVISENAIRDHNFVTKLRQAVDHMNEEETEKALLVFKDDIRQGKLPYLVRLLMSKNKPYLLWHEDEYAQRLFWEKFTKNMLVNKKMNDLLPV